MTKKSMALPQNPKRVVPAFLREQVSERLQAGLQQLRLAAPLSGATQQKLVDFLQALHEINQVHNLTAIRDPLEMVGKHVLDSLAVLPYLRGQPLLDVGSGGGIPGIPLLIAGGCERVVLVDSVGKKMRAAADIASQIGISAQVEALHSRVEALGPRYRFEQVIARAFSSLAQFASLCTDRIQRGGELLAMKGREPVEEIQALPPGWRVKATHALQVPFVEGERCLVVLARAH
jgi:16S rRNA (guanine527-N7)-methyltransferase